jgi:hypothetical protein
MVERVRTGAPAGHSLAMHLAECPRCAERWEAEMELSRGLLGVRSAVAGLRSAPDARERLMAEFDHRRRQTLLHRGFVWAMTAITILLLAGAVLQVQRAGRRSALHTAQAELDLRGDDLLADTGFMPVPYASPLAQGEYVEVVERDLTPAALARMGFVIQTAYNNNEVTAELMIGEDGLPRAVRVPESVGIRY